MNYFISVSTKSKPKPKLKPNSIPKPKPKLTKPKQFGFGACLLVTKFTQLPSSKSIDITLHISPPEILRNIDYVIANTGLQPDRSLYANLNIQECYRTKGPLALAIKLLSSSHDDCLKQTTHGASTHVALFLRAMA